MSTPETRLTDLESRVAQMNTLVSVLQQIEPSLIFLHNNLEFFKDMVANLKNKIATLEDQAHEKLPAQIAQHTALNKSEVVQQAAAAVKEALNPDIEQMRQSIDTFRRDVTTANLATKADVENLRMTSGTSSTHGYSSKPRVPPPSEFTGKRENWKTFSSHLSLFFTANAAQYPSDTEKILFAISRLGDGSAFKYMEQYIPDFQKPPEARPLVISNYNTFVTVMSENFGILNAHVVAEAQLRSLKQKGSAMDYTNKFLELATETDWNDAAKISQYRLGLKDAVQDMLALADEPKDFASFTTKAISIDKRQYARSVEKQNNQSTSRSVPSPARVALSTYRSSSPAAVATPTPIGPPSMAMDLSHARHITPEEKKRRQEKGLCLYCGAGDHFAKVCPNKKSLASTQIAETSFAFESVDFTLGNDQA